MVVVTLLKRNTYKSFLPLYLVWLIVHLSVCHVLSLSNFLSTVMRFVYVFRTHLSPLAVGNAQTEGLPSESRLASQALYPPPIIPI